MLHGAARSVTRSRRLDKLDTRQRSQAGFHRRILFCGVAAQKQPFAARALYRSLQCKIVASEARLSDTLQWSSRCERRRPSV